MVRFLVIALACLGAFFVMGVYFPSLKNVAFVAAGYSITWIMLLTAGVGVLSYKVTK